MPDATRLLGIDLGGTKIEGVVLGADGAVVARKRVATERDGGYDAILDRIASLAQEMRAHEPRARAIGIGTPGSVSARDGTLKNSNTLCLNGRRVEEDLEARIGLPVRVENDANCFALAEAHAGAGRGHDLVFGVILGTGVGGGIVWRGELRSGPQHVAGEWGHHSIDPAGPRCYCGARGCIETLLSGPALEAQYRDRAGSAAPAAEIARRAEAGEPAASAVMSTYLERFGRAVANLVNVLDPDAIVLGGGLSNLDVLYSRGREAVARFVFNDELRTPILRNELGDSAGVIGAAWLAAEPR